MNYLTNQPIKHSVSQDRYFEMVQPVPLASMVPTLTNFFRSYYYPCTYLPPIDLQRSVTEFSCPFHDYVAKAQSITSLPGVQQILSQPLSDNKDVVLRNNATLQKHNFHILGDKSHPYYNVSEHPRLPGWVIKTAGLHMSQAQLKPGQSNDHNEGCFFSPHDSLIRLNMNARIRHIARILNSDIIVPEEYAVPFANPPSSREINESYFIISRKLDLMSATDTTKYIESLSESEQEDLAYQLCQIIEHAGYADATFENIRRTRQGAWVIVDTEACGLMVPKGKLSRGHSVEKCARVGLFVLSESAQKNGLKFFSECVKTYYEKALTRLSITKIVLSILCPLIPLVFLVMSVVNKLRIQKLINEIDNRNLSPYFYNVDPLIKKRYFSLIEGVPFPMYSVNQTKYNPLFY